MRRVGDLFVHVSWGVRVYTVTVEADGRGYLGCVRLFPHPNEQQQFHWYPVGEGRNLFWLTEEEAAVWRMTGKVPDRVPLTAPW